MTGIIEGQKYNHITVIKKSYKNKARAQMYLCKCDCGKEYYLVSSRIGKNISCGCVRPPKGYNKKHGCSYTRLYKVWSQMKDRCLNPKSKRYEEYGGRGITIHPEWMEYVNFSKWAYENGYDGNAKFMKCTLDRIDCDGNYEPDNCRWVDMKRQGNNRRNNRKITYNGETHTLSEWSDLLGIKLSTLYARIRRGWTINEAFNRSVKYKMSLKERDI
jgi:hypothetical protein